MSFASMHNDYLDPDRAGLNDESDLSPKFCPRCGGQNLVLDVHEGIMEEGNRTIEPQSGCELAEHQCRDCEGASFWM